jgi:hypothetical protein
MTSIRVFQYLRDLDAFLVTEEYQKLAERLGLSEWHPTVWIGRLFTLDNDFGEHWFDNWDEREARQAEARKRGLEPERLLMIMPERFQDGRDGPCHPPEIRKRFWTDVLMSLEISYELLFEMAHWNNERVREFRPDDAITDLEERISEIALRAGRVH